MAKKELDPIDRDIIRSLRRVRLGATPSKIAKTINVHPVTVKKRVIRLSEKGILSCKSRGNRTYCKVGKQGGDFNF